MKQKLGGIACWEGLVVQKGLSANYLAMHAADGNSK